MRKKALFLGAMALVAVLISFGMWRYTTSALIPNPVLPIQPFAPDPSKSGLSSMQLGAQTSDVTDTKVLRGQRISIPWIYGSSDFGILLDKDVAKGADLGDIIAEIDALCNAEPNVPPLVASDWFAKSIIATPGPGGVPAGVYEPYRWLKTSTKIQLPEDPANPGQGDTWLAPLVPPYSWLIRHRAIADTFWITGTTRLATEVHLNTVFTSVPWSPNGMATTSTTKNGGNPGVVVPASDTVCIDSPQNSTSHTNDYTNPPLLGDSGRPCTDGACADAGIYGLWTQSNLAGSKAAVPVKKVIVNNGPNTGNFTDLWEIEVAKTSSATITATWDANSGTELNTAVTGLAPAVSTSATQNMSVVCSGTGEGLVVIKNILTPVYPTKDSYRDDNAATFVVKVVCGSPAALPTVDKAVIWVKPSVVGIAVPPLPTPLPVTPKHLNLVQGQSITLTVDELKVNNNVEDVQGKEWLVAEVSKTLLTHPTAVPAPPPTQGDLTVDWNLNTVTIDQGTGGLPTPPAPVPVTGVANCASGGDCITYTVNEPAGQSDVKATLTIACPALAEGGIAGTYAVVVKAIDVPVGYSESKPADNAQRSVITVNCWTNWAEWNAAKDGIDDGIGLYVRWTFFQSQPDSRLASDLITSDKSSVEANMQGPQGTYVERMISMSCYWMDVDGCNQAAPADPVVSCDTDGNGGIDYAETKLDYELVNNGVGGYNGIDPDGDCLPLAAYAQPGHAVDLPTMAGTCSATSTPAWVAYSGKPTQTTAPNLQDADQDCDGLRDGVEKAWGSNPLLQDSDNDGAPDFVEMGQFTNPGNPDTDGDGLWDKPENNYQASAVGVADPNAAERGAECADALDNDGDGWINDGCPKVGSASETLCADALDNDAAGPDGAINDGCGTKGDLTTNGWGTVANADDNCPTVYNPDQTNTDGLSRDAGGGVKASNPNQDIMGDACDPDLDNDGLVNANEESMGTDPLKNDTDADGWVNDGCPQVGSISESGALCANTVNDDSADDSRVNDGCPQYGPVAETSTQCNNAVDDDSDGCVDGTEAFVGTNALNGKLKCPAALNGAQLKFFHACRWNLPQIGEFSGDWNAKNSVGADRTEWDADGDGVDCYKGIDSPAEPPAWDDDNDNGVGVSSPAPPVEISDVVEIEGYDTNPALKDTDGDGCADWFEIADVNGDRKLSIGDVYLVATAPTGVAANDRVMDVNKDGKQSVGDNYLESVNSCAVKTGVGGCPQCPAEN